MAVLWKNICKPRGAN